MQFKFKFKKPSLSEFLPAGQPQGSISVFALSLGGNLFLAGLFLRALLNPVAHVSFIVQTGIWIFLVEFFSIFISRGAETGRKSGFLSFFTGTIGFLVISIFAIVFGWLFLGNIYLPLIFLGSTLAKIFGKRAMPDQPLQIYAIPLLLGSLLIVFFIFGPEFWVNLFPFPEEFSQAMPADWAARRERGEISGEFVDRPQTMLAWGVIYFALASIIESAVFAKGLKNVVKNSAPKVE